MLELAVQLALIAAVFALRFSQIDGRASPDCQYYLNMSVGRPTPRPYCYRVLIPWLTRLGYLLLPWKPLNIMRVIVTSGIFACAAAVYLLTIQLGGTGWQATAAVVLVLMADSLLGLWVMFPWLTDPWAYAFAISAALVGEPWQVAVLLALAAVTKEAAWALGTLFVLLSGAVWWVPLPGFLVLSLLRLLIKPAPPDTEWLQKPFKYAQNAKRRQWFDYIKSLSGLKASPYVAVWLLGGTTAALPAGVIALAAWLQTMVAVDHGRLIAVAFLWIVPMACAVCPENLLALWVLAQTFWPFETNWGA